MRLDKSSILQLCRLRDAFGVLSIYVGSPPEQQSGPHPAWAVEIKNQLSSLRSRVKDEGPRERWVAVSERLDDLSDEIDELLDPRAPGRGRALFAPVSSGEVRRITLQVPLPDLVVRCGRRRRSLTVVARDDGAP